MPKFEVDIPHTLSPDEVRTRLAGATGRLEEKYKVIGTWVNDRLLTVKRSGVDATVRIEEPRVLVQISLGFLLPAVAGHIKARLLRELSALFNAPAAPPAPAAP